MSFFGQTFNRSLIFADYYIHTESYAKDCENTAVPEMHCQGKCQMEKKLKAEDKKDKQNPGRNSENKNEITLSSRSFFASVYDLPRLYLTQIYPPYINGKETSIPHAVFRPPTT